MIWLRLGSFKLNPTNNNYQFPDFGAAPLSKVVDEEVKNWMNSHYLNAW
ncbi:MAG: hypothetical protein IPG85_07615 [Bacteroidetes bacterium]|nr:hypothetical protein [Bacteroidota bacterium]